MSSSSSSDDGSSSSSSSSSSGGGGAAKTFADYTDVYVTLTKIWLGAEEDVSNKGGQHLWAEIRDGLRCGDCGRDLLRETPYSCDGIAAGRRRRRRRRSGGAGLQWICQKCHDARAADGTAAPTSIDRKAKAFLDCVRNLKALAEFQGLLRPSGGDETRGDEAARRSEGENKAACKSDDHAENVAEVKLEDEDDSAPNLLRSNVVQHSDAASLSPGGGGGGGGVRKSGKKRGCRCGNATLTPGKLTCCGQRCPCYVDAKACRGCKCRGCRNPHTQDGRRLRPLPSAVNKNQAKYGASEEARFNNSATLNSVR